MNILVFMPIDTIAQAWDARLRADGHSVETTWNFAAFLRRVRWADWTLVNVTKHDSPKYIWKILLSTLCARLLRRRIALFITIDLVDLCDRPLPRAIVWAINWIAFRSATLVVLLATRLHIADRYSINAGRVLPVYNCPDRHLFRPLPHVEKESAAPLTFLYHGELLWWHGLERFIPIYEEIKKRTSARLIVFGNFYPSEFRLFGIVASRREREVKRQLAAVLARPDVEYRGRVPLEELQREMAAADFHVSLMNHGDEQARTELRTGLLEAMLSGMACLHAPTPALAPEILRDGENIILVDPSDPVGSADTILTFYRSADRLAAIRQSAIRTAIEHFDMDSEYRKLLSAIGATL